MTKHIHQKNYTREYDEPRHILASVRDGDIVSSWTVGRLEQQRKELFLEDTRVASLSLLDQIADRYDKGEVVIGAPFMHGEWYYDSTNEPVHFILTESNYREMKIVADATVDNSPATHLRKNYRGHGPCPQLTILLANEDNRFDFNRPNPNETFFDRVKDFFVSIFK